MSRMCFVLVSQFESPERLVLSRDTHAAIAAGLPHCVRQLQFLPFGDLVAHHIVSPLHHIASLHITTHQITSHHITSHHVMSMVVCRAESKGEAQESVPHTAPIGSSAAGLPHSWECAQLNQDQRERSYRRCWLASRHAVLCCDTTLCKSMVI